MTIQNKLKFYRLESGKKQDESAKIIGVTTRQYQNLEYATPKAVIQFYRLAKLYNTTIDALLEQDDDNEINLHYNNNTK